MDFKIFILLFTLVNAILARPGPAEEADEAVEAKEVDEDYGEEYSEYYEEEEWTVQCGTHNQDGLAKDGVTAKVEGVSAQEGEWPHACIIYNKEKIVGSASLVAPNVLVSAAHTLEMLSPGDLKIRCGEYDLGSDEVEQYEYQEREVKSITLHPFYTGPRSVIDDVAVIHTTKSFKQAPNVDTMCLPNPAEPFSKLKCSSMGWDSSKTTTMNQVQINITDSNECKASILNTGKVPETWNFEDGWLCSEDSQIKNVACEGSGGNSLVCQEDKTNRNVLAGIASFGVGCGEDIVAEIFTSLSDSICFIQFDTTCKYGSKYLDHYYYPECSDYLDDKIAELEDSSAPRAEEFIENAKFLKESCDIDLSIRRFQLG